MRRTQPDDYKKLLPLKKIAEASYYSFGYVSILVQRKKLKAKKIGNKYYSTKEWFDQYLEMHGRDEKKLPENLVGELNFGAAGKAEETPLTPSIPPAPFIKGELLKGANKAKSQAIAQANLKNQIDNLVERAIKEKLSEPVKPLARFARAENILPFGSLGREAEPEEAEEIFLAAAQVETTGEIKKAEAENISEFKNNFEIFENQIPLTPFVKGGREENGVSLEEILNSRLNNSAEGKIIFLADPEAPERRLEKEWKKIHGRESLELKALINKQNRKLKAVKPISAAERKNNGAFARSLKGLKQKFISAGLSAKKFSPLFLQTLGASLLIIFSVQATAGIGAEILNQPLARSLKVSLGRAVNFTSEKALSVNPARQVNQRKFFTGEESVKSKIRSAVKNISLKNKSGARRAFVKGSKNAPKTLDVRGTSNVSESFSGLIPPAPFIKGELRKGGESLVSFPRFKELREIQNNYSLALEKKLKLAVAGADKKIGQAPALTKMAALEIQKIANKILPAGSFKPILDLKNKALEFAGLKSLTEKELKGRVAGETEIAAAINIPASLPTEDEGAVQTASPATTTPVKLVARADARLMEILALVADKNGRPINGEYDVRFALYSKDRSTSDAYPSDSDAISRVWEETQKLTIKNGELRAYVGQTKDLPLLTLLGAEQFYLGIRLAADSEMIPRKRLPAPFYAFNALNALELNGRSVGARPGNIPLLLSQGKNTGRLDYSIMPTEITDFLYKATGGTVSVTAPAGTGSGTSAATTTAISPALLNTDFGGTGLTSYAKGDILYYDSGKTLTRLGIGSDGQALTIVNGVPAWSNLKTSTVVLAGGGGASVTYTAGTNLALSDTTFSLASALTGISSISGVNTISQASADLTLQTTTSGDIIFSPAAGSYVGIASTSPWGLLSINPDGLNGPSFVIGSSTAASFIVTNGGYVGIGTTSPSQALSIAGKVYATEGFQFPDGSVMTSASSGGTAGTAGQLSYYAADGTTTSGTSTLFLTPTGQFGVGTSTPYSKLTVWGSGSGSGQLVNFINSASSSLFTVLENGSIGVGTASPAGFFDVNGKLTVLSNGNIGLGTTTPNWNLQIASSTKTFLTLSDMSAGADLKHWFMSSMGGNFYLGTSSDALAATGTALAINRNGYIGIGTTTPRQKLAVAGYADFSQGVCINGSCISNWSEGGSIDASGSVVGAIAVWQDANTLTASTTLSVAYGGTGSTTLSGILVGNSADGIRTLALPSFLSLSGSTLSLGTLGVANGGTGAASFGQGWLGINDSGAFISSTSPTVAYLYATSTLATSTFMGGLVAGNNGALVINQGASANSLTINNSGNVGIGTANPSSKLTVYDTTNSSAIRLAPGATGGFYIRSGAANDGEFSAGYEFINGSAIARATSASGLNFFNGKTYFINKTGLTSGNAFTPSYSMLIDTNGNVGIGTTSPYSKLSVWGSDTSSTILANFANSASTSLFSILNNGYIGIASSSPSTYLSVHGNSLLGSDLTSTLGLNLGTINYWQTATSTIVDNQLYAWTIATSTSATPIFSIQTATGQIATSSFNGGFVLDNGAFTYDSGSGLTSISGLEVGALNFDDDLGAISWVDMTVSSDSAAGSIQSYTAQLNANPVLTVYGTANGVDGVNDDLAVGIGTTTPLHALDVLAGSTTPFTTGKTANYYGINVLNQATSSVASLIKAGLNIQSTGDWTGSGASNIGLYVSSVTGGTNNYDAIFNGGGNVGIGTSSPSSKLTVWGSGTGSTQLVNFVNSASTSLFTVLENGNIGIATSSPLANLTVSSPSQKDGTEPIFDVASTTGARLFTVLGNGNVGVGKTNPAYKLDVTGVVSASQEFHTGSFYLSAFGNGYFYSSSNRDLITVGSLASGGAYPWRIISGNSTYTGGYTTLETDGAERARINSTGFGVGTTSPWAMLSVNGTSTQSSFIPLFAVATSTGTATSTAFIIDANGKVGIGTSSPSGTNVLAVQGTSYFNGNVGIGTANPTSKLVVNGGDVKLTNYSSLYGSQFFTDQTGNNSGYFYNSVSNGGLMFVSPGYSVKLFAGSGGHLLFNTSAGEVMRLDSSGRVGIASTSPFAMLSVNGTSTQSSFIPLFAVASSTGTATNTAFLIDSNGNVGIGTSTLTGYNALSVQGTSYFNGNVGIGTANPGSYKLSVNGSIYTAGNITSQDRVYLRGSNMDVVNANATEGMEWTSASAGGSLFFKTAGVDRMRIANSGNIGIGTTSPYSKLTVWGSDTSSGTVLANFVNSASTSLMTILNNGYVGIASSSPSTYLSVHGNSLLGSGVDSVLGLNLGTINYWQTATSTIVDNQLYAWTIATSTSADPIIRIETATGLRATTTIDGGFVVNGGLSYDYGAGVTSINSLETGPLNFDVNAGKVSWVDLPLDTDITASGTPQSYTAHINGNPILTVYAETDGYGEISATSPGVGIGTTTPLAMLDIFAGSTTAFTTGFTRNYDALAINNQATSSIASLIKTGINIQSSGDWTGAGAKNIGLYVSSVTGGTNNYDAIFNGGGYVGIGTSTPYSKLSVWGSGTGSNVLANFVNSASTSLMTILENGNIGIATSSPLANLTVSSPSQKAGTEPIFDVASTTGARLFTVLGNGNVGIGTAAPTSALSFRGGSVVSVATADASDSGSLAITGAGAADYSRGAYINLHGNEHANKGSLYLAAGQGDDSNTAGQIIFYTSATGGGALNQQMTIMNSPAGGTLPRVGVGTSSPMGSFTVAPDTIEQVLSVSVDGASPQSILTVYGGMGGKNLLDVYKMMGGTRTDGLYIDSNSRISIGTTTNASTRFLVSNNLSDSNILSLYDSNGNNRFKVQNDGTGYFSGNIGIGTTSPYAKLSLTNTSDMIPLAIYGFNSQTSPLFLVASSTGIATSTAFIIDHDGNVGINAANPMALLQVGTASSSVEFGGGLNTPYFGAGEYQNYILQNETLGTTWVAIFGEPTVSSNSVYNPRNDALTAETLNAGSTDNAQLGQYVTSAVKGSWTFSIWLRATTTPTVNLVLATVNGSATSTIATTTIANMDSTWRRYAVTVNDSGTFTKIYAGINNGTSGGVYAWGAQLEPVAYARQYAGAITTTAVTALTRTTHINSAAAISSSLTVGSTLAISGTLTGVTSLTMAGALSGVTTLGLSNILTQSRVTLGTSTAATSNGIVLANTTAATAGLNAQWSPRLLFNGYVWDTGAGASRLGSWFMQNQLFTGNPGTSSLSFNYAYNGQSTTTPLVIDSSGHVGIGTTSPASTLDVAGSAAFGLGDEVMRIDSTGLVGIGTSTPWGLLSVNANGLLSGTPQLVVGSSTATHFIIDNAGKVGIGTSTPYAKLSIVDNTASLRDVLAISTSTSGLIFKVDSYGGTYADAAYSGAGADYAEYFRSSTPDLLAGEIVCVDILENSSVKRCERGHDNNVMGIVSTKPSIIGNNTAAVRADLGSYAVIGMLGQVDAYVSDENGPIQIGDSLTSASSTQGYAMKADGGDSTVAVALEAFGTSPLDKGETIPQQGDRRDYSNGESPLPPLSRGQNAALYQGGTAQGGNKGKIKVLISRRNKSLAVEEVEQLVIERIANMKIEDQVQQMIKQAVDNLNLDPKIEAIAKEEAGRLDAVLSVSISDVNGQISRLDDKIFNFQFLISNQLSIFNDQIFNLNSQIASTTALAENIRIDESGNMVIGHSAPFNKGGEGDLMSDESPLTPLDKGGNVQIINPALISASSSQAAFVVNQAGDGEVADFQKEGVSILNIAANGQVKVMGSLLVDGRIMLCSSGFCSDALDSAVDETSADLGVEGKVVAGAFEGYCEDGFVWVPGSAKYGTLPGFCVMNDLMKKTSDVGMSDVWVNISQGEAQMACQSLGAGYHLLGENEWLTIAENILAVGENDINKETAGMQLASNDAPLTKGDEGGLSASSSIPLTPFIKGAEFKLTNDNLIYNLVGALGQWTNQNVTAAGLPVVSERDSWLEYNEVSDYKGLDLAPDYYLTDENNQIGRIYIGSDSGLKGFVRGYNGIYGLDLSHAPSEQNAAIGFRCAK